MDNNLTSADIANLVEIEVQRRMTEAKEHKAKQLGREDLNNMSWQEVNKARAEGRLDNVLYGKGE
ncbi:hypothetical protein [Streptomyces sp. NPDC003393]